jgi:hypothetical protein
MRYLTSLDSTGGRHETYRDADTPEYAAHLAAKAWYRDARVESSRTGVDTHGPYQDFTARTDYSRIPARIRVYVPNAPWA